MTKICPKCDTEHSRSGLYCCRSCANSRSFSDEAKQKKSIASKKFYDTLSQEKKQEINERLLKCSLNRSGLVAQGRSLDKLIEAEFYTLNHQNKRKRIIIEQDFRCGCCGIDTWLGKSITFELEHIDGNRQNNVRHNLVALCPNCHSLSWSWRGRKNSYDEKTNSERFREYVEMLKKASVV